MPSPILVTYITTYLPLHHSYIFLLYAQPANFTAAAIAPLADAPLILGFNVSEFARTTGLGNPVAGTYFLAGPSYNDSNEGWGRLWNGVVSQC